MTKCAYCGEEEATEKIANPNLDMGEYIDWQDEKSWWQVCKDCKEVIKLQRLNSFGVMTNDKKIINDTNKKLMEIAERTKKPIMNATITKTKRGYEYSSVEFRGKMTNLKCFSCHTEITLGNSGNFKGDLYCQHCYMKRMDSAINEWRIDFQRFLTEKRNGNERKVPLLSEYIN